MVEKKRRESRAAVALICRRKGNENQWLTRWNKNWQCYYFIGGHKLDGESYRECMMREIREELGIRREDGFTVSPEACARLEYAAHSKSAEAETDYTVELFGVKAETEYEVELFDVRLVGEVERKKIQSKQAIRWLNEEEIRAGQCADGLPVSETMVRVLDHIGWQCPDGAIEDAENRSEREGSHG